MKKFLTLMLAVIMMATLFAGCSNDENVISNSPAEPTNSSESMASDGNKPDNNTMVDDAAKEYHFAMIAPLTGNNAQYGLAYKKAIDLLVEQTNNNGGINGGKVVVDFYDDKNDATEAVTIANSVIEQPEILGCVGSQTSTPSMAIAPLFQKAGITLVSPNASHTDFAAIGNYIFRTTYMTSASSAAIGDNTYDLLSKQPDGVKAGIIYMQTDWGLAFNEYFTKQLTNRGGEVLVAEPYVVEQTNDFTPLLTKIKNAGCNTVVLGTNYNEGGQIVKQAKNLNMEVEFVASTMLYKQEFIDLVGADGEGIYVMTMFNKNNTSVTYQNMKAAYIEKYGSDDDIDEYITKAYDAMKLLIDGATVAGHDRDGIRDFIAGIQDWEGATNTISMDAEGNPSGPVYSTVIKDGKFEFID
jgi:branched-chain amino acid transport system substrate-binding protein